MMRRSLRPQRIGEMPDTSNDQPKRSPNEIDAETPICLTIGAPLRWVSI